MELQSRSSVRDRLSFFGGLMLHLGETNMHLNANENSSCECCSTFFFRLRRDALRAEAAGYAQSIYLYGYVAV